MVSETGVSKRRILSGARGLSPIALRSAIALGLVALASDAAWAAPQNASPQPSGAGPITPTAIHQELDFKAGPQRVYDALMDAKQFTAFSGAPAEMHPEPGGAFSLFGGLIVGRNIELVANRRIVQAWRSNAWPEGVYSVVKFELKGLGSGTRLVLDHSGFTEDKRESLSAGWKSHYWEPLEKFLQH